MGVPGSRGALGRSPKNLMIQRHVGYQFSQFSTLKMNTGSTNFKPDSHGVTHGRPWVQDWPRCWSPVYCPPRGSTIFLGGFWHLSQLKFEEISPKIPRMQILRKLAPLLVPFTVPPVPPGGSKNFLGGVWHLVRSNPSHLAQKIRQNHQFWSNRCMTPSVAAVCSGIHISTHPVKGYVVKWP